MTKARSPLFSLQAIGSLGKHLVFRRHGQGIVAQQKPEGKDVRSFAQQQWRTMYQKAVALWHTLSPSEQAAWERQATPRHMTGFAYFVSQALRPNPGIYLPLAGGEMQGEIAMDSNKITALPAPTADEEPTRKAELDAHKVLETAVHGLAGHVGFSSFQTSGQTILIGVLTTVNFHAKLWDVGGYFNLTTNRYTPLVAGDYLFLMANRLNSLTAGNACLFYLKKNGATYAYLSQISAGATIYHTLPGSRIVPMNGSTDYVELVCYHNQAP